MTRIIWETHYVVDARMCTCTNQSQRDALRMLHTLRRHPEFTDFDLAEFIGRTTHEVFQWWRLYESAGLSSLLMSADGSSWMVISAETVDDSSAARSAAIPASSDRSPDPHE